MVSCDWANGDSVGIFFRHGMVSGLWQELMLFQGMSMKYEYGPLQEFYVGYMMFLVNRI